MNESTIAHVFRIATAPARLAIRQTRTNLRVIRELREDYRAYRPVLERAVDETLANLTSVMVAAERSLPDRLEDMTPQEREEAIAASLARSEQYLLAAFGEMYRSYRIATREPRDVIIENPPQEELKGAARNT